VPPTVWGLLTPISGYSSERKTSESPNLSEAWPIRPDASLIRIDTVAPNAFL